MASRAKPANLEICLLHPQLHEDSIINTLETLCSTDKPDGAWITHYDIVEDGDKLKLVDTGRVCVEILQQAQCLSHAIWYGWSSQ